ncbi:MAG TPA: hypothetical protein DDX39_04270 [Bacteroidales bacterium]|nr:MAG: hypothetical protein A2W98_09430 [Bacteroidetes bacterium GWF2_33_38]OFY87628.1 MAG: hypothetical protein A2236_10545 [Bacteroidetes bacterium RIFOXYA2_FULL_33_7]HBF87838.1 hypothetical protein [Bacteroidales bacterium]
MKKILFIALAFVVSINTMKAQNSTGKMDDKGRLALTAWVPEQIESMPVAARKNLENKLSQIITSNGMAGSPFNSRFIITANVTVLTKDLTATAPPMQAYTLDVTLYIGDGFEGKSFASYSTTVKGVGENETKAYMAALKNIKSSNPEYQAFIEKGKNKIIEYYNTQCDFIIKEAQTLESQNKFDEAIWKLTSVPDVCADCFNKCMDAVAPIFKKKIDYDCKVKLTEANNVWAASQNYDGASSAGAILSTIDPEAACYNEAKALSSQMAKRVLEIDKREWNLTWEQEVGLERDRIKAYRDIGVAWGNGQPQNVTYKSLW